jgi:hypothetical protein
MSDDTPAVTPKRAEKRPQAEANLVAQSRPGRPTVDDLRKIHNPPAWLHEAAAVIHGWAEHAHAFSRPIRLTGADYEKALEAAARPNAAGEYEPHAPALSAAKAPRKS